MLVKYFELGQHIHTIIVSWYALHVQYNVSYAQGIIKDRLFTVHLDPPQLMHFAYVTIETILLTSSFS